MWSNWSRGQSCAPAEHVRPASRAELSEAVARGRAVRVAGAGHSFSGVVPTDGTLLSLDRLDRVLDVDRDSGLVRAEAGIRLHRLVRELHAHGLALPNLGDIDAQSLAGALVTGTHGTGAKLGNLAASVEAMELVLADGSELTVDGGDELRAARVGLGALGVVAAVTLRCVPAFRLHAVDRPLPLDDVLGELDRHVDGNDHFELFTFPHSPIALTRTNNRSDAPPIAAAPAPRVAAGRRARQPRVRAPQPRRPPRAEDDPEPQPARRPQRLAARAGGRLLRRLRQPAARALRGDGVRAAARARRRGDARRARRSSSATRSRSRSSCASRPATTPCSRPRTRARRAYVAVHVFEGMASRRRSARSRP